MGFNSSEEEQEYRNNITGYEIKSVRARQEEDTIIVDVLFIPKKPQFITVDVKIPINYEYKVTETNRRL